MSLLHKHFQNWCEKSIHIPGGLHTHQYINIKGIFTGERFHINLQRSSNYEDGVLLHINPRLDQQEIILNNYEDGWGEEESSVTFPFQSNHYFTIQIYVSKHCFKVRANEQEVIRFAHRGDLGSAHYIELDGDAHWHELQVNNYVKTPHFSPIERDVLRIGSAIRVRGQVNDDAERFQVDLEDEDGNVVLHVNPRFDEGVLVRNTCVDGEWGEEERDSDDFNMQRGRLYTIDILILEHYYVCCVDGTRAFHYSHRMPIPSNGKVCVTGDTQVFELLTLHALDKPVVTAVRNLEYGDAFEVYLSTTTYDGGERFAINLSNGNSEEDDCALHFNPRYESREAVINSQRDGGWQEENILSWTSYLDSNQIIKVVIIASREGYEIYLNDSFFHLFPHRDDLEDVKNILCFGDAYFYRVKHLKAFYRRHNPFIVIPRKLKKGWVKLTGRTNCDVERFHFNLADRHHEDGALINLHVNPRFDEGAVVFNSMEEGDWQDELQVGHLPFGKGSYFEFLIRVTPTEFVIFCNGARMMHFEHRLPIGNARFVTVDGDSVFYEPDFH